MGITNRSCIISGNNEKILTSGVSEKERWRYPRFFSEIIDVINKKILIKGCDANHIKNSLRMKPGNLAVICDNNNKDYLSCLENLKDETAEFKIIDVRNNDAEPEFYLRLFQCVPKGDKLDFITQKSVELGVSEIVPVISKRCVSRPDKKSRTKKTERLKKIAYEASKQCGRGKIPFVNEYMDFNDALKIHDDNSLSIIFYEGGGVKIKDILNFKNVINIITGSEGGFEEDEIKKAAANGFSAATLGRRILRAETAPICAISVITNLL